MRIETSAQEFCLVPRSALRKDKKKPVSIIDQDQVAEREARQEEDLPSTVGSVGPQIHKKGKVIEFKPRPTE